MQRTRLKGGSLSGTYLITDGSRCFVRKDASLIHNREYGFQRWYSQLKRLQRYGHLFPGVFPELLGYGQDGDLAYFDIEYIEEAVTVQQFLAETTDSSAILAMFSALQRVMATMHQIELPSTRAPLDLYIEEEVTRKISAVSGHERFKELSSHASILFNGAEVRPLVSCLPSYVELFQRAYQVPRETFTHGNLTLENVLYQPASGRIVFIDPYEENIIDSVLCDYSQIYQSSNSRYEIYNAGIPTIDGRRVNMDVPSYPGLTYFNEIFTEFLCERHDENDRLAIKLFEVSQFMRMLPFKMEIDEPMMLFFYAHGSHLFQELL